MPLGSLRRDDERDSPTRTTAERSTCELCGEVRQCLDEFGMTACLQCRDDFLPASGGL